MTDTTDIVALRNKFGTKLPTADDAKEKFIELLNGPHASSWFLAPYVIAFLDAFEAERQRADKAELELIKPLPIGELIQRLEGQTYEKWFSQSDLKGDQVPVGEIVAWAATNREMGITREVDFRFLRFDVKPGTKLYAIEPAPAVKSDFLTRAQALAVETRALASRIQAGE